MDTRTIPLPQWQTVFDSLSRVYDGSTASLEVLAADLGAQFEVEGELFRGISYDKSGIELHFTNRRGEHLVHQIPRAKSVLIEEGTDGFVAAIAIDSDESEAVLRLSFAEPWRLLPTATE